VHAAPDLRQLEKLLKATFTELRAAVGLRPLERKKKVRRKRQSVSAVAAIEKTIPEVAQTVPGISPLDSKRVPEPATVMKPEHALPQLVVV